MNVALEVEIAVFHCLGYEHKKWDSFFFPPLSAALWLKGKHRLVYIILYAAYCNGLAGCLEHPVEIQMPFGYGISQS